MRTSPVSPSQHTSRHTPDAKSEQNRTPPNQTVSMEKKFEMRWTGPVTHDGLFNVNCFARKPVRGNAVAGFCVRDAEYIVARMSPATCGTIEPRMSLRLSGLREATPVDKKFELRLTGPVNHGVLFKVNCFAQSPSAAMRGGFLR
jgi:hypothetical protein